MKEFLVAIDGSDGSDAAIDEALALAREAGARITFAFVRRAPSMLALFAFELIPQAFRHRRWLRAGAGSALGAAAMLALAAIAGV